MVRGSVALQYRAKPRTIPKRLAHWAGCAPAGCVAHSKASSLVMEVAPA
jgi:hypothetical protein